MSAVVVAFALGVLGRVRVWDVNGVTGGRGQGGVGALGAIWDGNPIPRSPIPKLAWAWRITQVQPPDLQLCTELEVEGVCPMWASPPPD